MKHSLDRKMDRILERENSGRIKRESGTARSGSCLPTGCQYWDLSYLS